MALIGEQFHRPDRATPVQKTADERDENGGFVSLVKCPNLVHVAGRGTGVTSLVLHCLPDASPVSVDAQIMGRLAIPEAKHAVPETFSLPIAAASKFDVVCAGRGNGSH